MQIHPEPIDEESIKKIYKRLEPLNIPFVCSPQKSEGIKYDEDKVDYTLIPPYALQAVAKNLTAGLKKYKERDNWKKVPDAQNRYMKALYRHLEAIRRGEIYDPEALMPGTTHMSAVIANAMFIQEFMDNPELNKEKANAGN